MAIDLVRQLNYLISRGIYHNDIKCGNIVVSIYNGDYYINLIDYGLCITMAESKLTNYLLTTYNAYSPEYYKINLKYKQGIRNLVDLKYLLNKSTHWIIGAIIINILVWEEIQYNIWRKYYYMNKHLHIIQKYNNIDLGYKYIIDLLDNFISITELYIDTKFMYNIQDIILEVIEKDYSDLDIYKYTIDKLKTNTTYYKPELLTFILNIFNLLEYNTNNKKDISTIYTEINDYPNYLNYVRSKKKFI